MSGWRPLFEHGPAAPVGAIAVAPSNPEIIYIGTGQIEPRYDVQAGMGVFRSGDGGKTWTSLGLEKTRYIGKIWVDPGNADTVLVGAQGHFFGPNAERGLFRSTDGGKSWTQALKIDDGTGVVDIASDPKDPKVLFAAAWLIGVTTRSRREAELAVLAEASERSESERQESARAVAEERLRIAQELHDVVAHSMSVIAVP